MGIISKLLQTISSTGNNPTEPIPVPTETLKDAQFDGLDENLGIDISEDEFDFLEASDHSPYIHAIDAPRFSYVRQFEKTERVSPERMLTIFEEFRSNRATTADTLASFHAYTPTHTIVIAGLSLCNNDFDQFSRKFGREKAIRNIADGKFIVFSIKGHFKGLELTRYLDTIIDIQYRALLEAAQSVDEHLPIVLKTLNDGDCFFNSFLRPEDWEEIDRHDIQEALDLTVGKVNLLTLDFIENGQRMYNSRTPMDFLQHVLSTARFLAYPQQST